MVEHFELECPLATSSTSSREETINCPVKCFQSAYCYDERAR